MEFVNLGSTGAMVSRICLGTMTYGSKKWREWNLEEDEARPIIHRAVELGINFFDTADQYSAGVGEEIVGRALKDFFPSRDDLFLATKVGNRMGSGPNDRGLSRKRIMACIDASLRRLGVDYVDLYIIHRADPDTPIEETLYALNDIVRAGKARYIGASSMFAWQFLKMLEFQRHHGLARFVTMQDHYNLVYREEEREMIPLCLAEKVGITPWSPLARGFLSGTRKRGEGKGETVRSQTDEFAHALYYKDSDFTVAERVTEIAQRRGVNNALVALAWLLSRPGVVAPVVGASKINHLDDAVASLQLKLDPSEIAALEEPYEPHKVLGHHYGRW